MKRHTELPLGPRVLFALFMLLGAAGTANAVPSYARQTGQECPACHVSWPELTPYGRFFKATGYTIGRTFWSSGGDGPYVPAAVMAQASITHLNNNNTIDPATGDTVTVMPRQNLPVFNGASLFLATKLNDYMGVFYQWTYDNLAYNDQGVRTGHKQRRQHRHARGVQEECVERWRVRLDALPAWRSTIRP